jgi:hypothetical protein
MSKNDEKPVRVYIRKKTGEPSLSERIEKAAKKASDVKELPIWWDEQAVKQAEIKREMYNAAMANYALHVRRNNIKEG